jgi:Calcineurin-like phosphoesterase
MTPLTMNPVVAGRIRKAWQSLSPAKQAQISPMIQAGHTQAELAANSIISSIDTHMPRALLLAHTALSGDAGGILGSISSGVQQHVANDGTMLGTGKYESFDPGWLEALAVWLENIPQAKGPFSTDPQVITIPDKVTIAMAGDWGTGDWRRADNPAPAAKVAKGIAALRPDYTIHLGDVYYSGTSDEEQHLLVDLWPRGTAGAFALNSNHEMYSGAKPYFLEALSSQLFNLQRQCSFFALENSNWVIVGLDSAYHSDELQLYLNGSLGTDGSQTNFLRQQAAKGKKVIVLTHHNGLVADGSQPDQAVAGADSLYSQVVNAFPPKTGPAYWYWAHVHSAIAYTRQDSGTLCRCCGHGAVPLGDPSPELQGKKNIVWFESDPANDPDIPQRILNGFASLTLDGQSIQETFYDENGRVRWSSQ